LQLERLGDDRHPKAKAMLLSDGPKGTRWNQATGGTTFCDLAGNIGKPMTLDADGYGEFWCKGGSVSDWVLD
jgi:alpha-amylase